MRRDSDPEAPVDRRDPLDGEDFPEEDFPEGDLPEPESLDSVDLRDALRGALRPPPGSVAPKLLPGVQQRLRVRSGGKFYGDGWSTSESPRTTYLVTSVLMLLLVLLVFFVLVPWSSSPL